MGSCEKWIEKKANKNTHKGKRIKRIIRGSTGARENLNISQSWKQEEYFLLMLLICFIFTIYYIIITWIFYLIILEFVQEIDILLV